MFTYGRRLQSRPNPLLGLIFCRRLRHAWRRHVWYCFKYLYHRVFFKKNLFEILNFKILSNTQAQRITHSLAYQPTQYSEVQCTVFAWVSFSPFPTALTTLQRTATESTQVYWWLFGGAENAGHENEGPNCKAWKCRTWKWWTKFQGMKMQDMKMQDTKMQDMKMQDMKMQDMKMQHTGSSHVY